LADLGDVDFIYWAPVAPQVTPAIPVDARVAGFFGRAGLFVDQLGVILSRPL
jgi:hypothetical protein